MHRRWPLVGAQREHGALIARQRATDPVGLRALQLRGGTPRGEGWLVGGCPVNGLAQAA